MEESTIFFSLPNFGGSIIFDFEIYDTIVELA